MNFKIIFAILTLSLFTFAGSAQIIPTNEASLEQDHQELREMKAIYEKAVNENNLELLKPLMREDFSFVTFMDSEFDRKRDDFEKFKKDWMSTREKLLQGGSYTVELLPERSTIIGNFAIARGDTNNVIKRGDGKTFSFHAKWTALCIKEDGTWKVIRAQNTLNPLTNPLLEDGVKSMLIKASVFSGILGLILGCLFGWLFSRKKHSPEVQSV